MTQQNFSEMILTRNLFREATKERAIRKATRPATTKPAKQERTLPLGRAVATIRFS